MINNNFLDVIESHVKDTKGPSVIFRYKNSYGFMELKPTFVQQVIDTARQRISICRTGIDDLNALEKLALYVLEEAHYHVR